MLIIDYRDEEIIYPGNRFMVYAMHPEQNISIHVIWGKDKQNIVYSTGKSIINLIVYLKLRMYLVLFKKMTKLV